MFRYRIRTLFILTAIVAILFAFAPTAIRICSWRQQKLKIDGYSKSNFLIYGYEDINALAKPHFDSAIAKLKGLGPFADDVEKRKILENCVKELNTINSSRGERETYIATVEREMFCKVLTDLATMVGINIDEDLDEWRDW